MASPDTLPRIDATPLDEVDRMLGMLAHGQERWLATDPATRAALLRRCMEATAEVSEEWGDTACVVKGYESGSNGHGEEFLGGVLAVMRNLRLFAEALEHHGQPPLPKKWQRPDGQWVAQVFPQSLMDKALFTGVTCDVWMEPGKLPTQGQLYRKKVAGEAGPGGICVVLGAGNQSSIPPMDVLYKLVVDDEVCILKMNPVNEALGPILEKALRPLVDGGFLRICYGGIEVGKHLTDHPEVHSIHITGSAYAHDAIVWGVGEEGAANKTAGTPRLDKPITSELGSVSPVLVVPGAWKAAELDHHARQVASMLAYNCGFNCNGARLIVVAKGWAQREQFFTLVREKLAATPTRKAYYPTAQRTFDGFTEQYPEAETLGDHSAPGVLPWTILGTFDADGEEYAFGNEPWAGIFSFVELDASDAASFLDRAVPFANDRCWGTLAIQMMVDPRTEKALGERLDQAIADLRYGSIAINCWTGLNYGLVNATWGAFPGHPLDDIQSGQGVVHNGLLLDHPQKSVVKAPFVMAPTPAWFTDHKNNLGLGRQMVAFELAPSWFGVPGVAMQALKG
jgi:hypothetical protein